MNDVRVIGLVMQTVRIADIGMDVPHGATVVIPADKAAISNDLRKLISQRMLFRLNHGPLSDYSMSPPPAAVPSVEVERLREENRFLAEQNRMLRQVVDSHGSKLDTILGFIESIRSEPRVGTLVRENPPAAKSNTGVVSTDIPTYIPSEIKPRAVESHVEVESSTSEGSNIADAGEALRKLRRGTR